MYSLTEKERECKKVGKRKARSKETKRKIGTDKKGSKGEDKRKNTAREMRDKKGA
jgi:hypothetical protein